MCFTKLRVEVEQWEDEGVFLVSRLSVESVPAGDVVQEERDEEETCEDRMGDVDTVRQRLQMTFSPNMRHIPIPNLSSIVQFGHQDDVCEGVDGGK